MRRLRIGAVLGFLVLVTPPLMLLQWLAVKAGWRLAHTLPVFFHRMVCMVLRIRVTAIRHPAPERPLLVLANHSSWLDITVISTLMPVSFIAKSEVGTWPVFGSFARLQRSIFIDRTRRQATAGANRAIAERLAEGDAIVLFAEGTTNDGHRLLPFRSALVGAARDAIVHAGHDRHVVIQPLSVAYPRRGGLPVARAERPAIAWHGDMDLVPHLAAIIAGPPIDAVVVWGEPIAFDRDSDRKAVTRRAEDCVRAGLAAARSGEAKTGVSRLS